MSSTPITVMLEIMVPHPPGIFKADGGFDEL
jgi:hypothetical protein